MGGCRGGTGGPDPTHPSENSQVAMYNSLEMLVRNPVENQLEPSLVDYVISIKPHELVQISYFRLKQLLVLIRSVT